jgi:signal transduction histidine kinase/CheY-like chemotaxis protein
MLTNETTFPALTKATRSQADQEYLYHEQIKLAYNQYHICSVASLGGYIVLPILLWNHVSHFNIFLWLAISFSLLTLPPLFLLHKYRKADDAAKKESHWGPRLSRLALAGTTAWGSLGLLLYPADSIVLQFVLIFFISAAAALATIVSASYQPLFWAKIVPILAPFSLNALFQGDLMHTIMGLGIPVVYGGSLVFIHRNLYANLQESLALRLSNSQLVEQLNIKKQAAEKASADKSRFLAAASHDLRQPLHAQMLLVDGLKEKTAGQPAADTVHKLESSMKAMNGLFNELLDISKLDANVVNPNITVFPIDEVLEEVALDFSEIAGNKSLRFRVRRCNTMVRSDRQLLSRILRNLLSNAVRYTRIGGVLLGCRVRGNKLLIQVWDTGSGIPNNQSALIFDEFYQLSNPERDRNKGLGLGLAIVARLAKLLGHRVKVNSRVREGSVFSLEVPRITNVSVPVKPLAKTALIQDDLRHLRVLLVEDDELILSTMRELLLKWGCDVFAARSFNTAMNHVGSLINGVDLIIADYRLQNNATGMQVILKMEGMLKTAIPSIVITGDSSPEILREIHRSGRYLLHKPVTPEKLRCFIKEVLADKRSEQAVYNVR